MQTLKPRPKPPTLRGRIALDGPLPAAAITLLIHALLLAWIVQAGQLRPHADTADDSRLWVEWLSPEPASALAEPPPMPQAPSRPSRPSRITAAPSDTMPSPSTPTAPPALQAEDSAPAAPGRLIDRIQGQIDDAGRITAPSAGSLLERPSPRLPGRGEAFVEGIRVPEELSPADYVAMVSRIFGARKPTCTDLRGKIMSDISDAERRRLIDDERQICRRGRAETFR